MREGDIENALTCQRTIVFNAIVDVEIAQVERIIPVVSAEHVCGEIGDEEAEARGEVVRLADFCVQLPEADTASGVRQYS